MATSIVKIQQGDTLIRFSDIPKFEGQKPTLQRVPLEKLRPLKFAEFSPQRKDFAELK